MKLITTLFLLIPFFQGFTQDIISKTGSFCNETIALNVALEPGVTVISWEKDGVVLEGEATSSISCVAYGAGNYSVILQEGDETKKLSILIENDTDLTPGFTATNYLAAAVTFFADESISSEEIIAWNWDFGNGETSSEQNPRVMFTDQKEYTITLTVTTSAGCTGTITKTHLWAYK